MASMETTKRAWDGFLRVLKLCNLYVPGPYKYQEKLKSWRFTMFLARCWCCVWTAMASFGVGNTTAPRDILNIFEHSGILRGPPYSPPMYGSLQTATILSFLSFAWNLLCSVTLLLIPWHHLLTIPDLAFTIALGATQSKLPAFIPRSNGTCNNDITLWNVPADGRPNWFVVAANLTEQTPQKVCNNAVGATFWFLVILAHEALISILSLMFVMPDGHLFSMGTFFGALIRLTTWVLREPVYLLYYFNRKRKAGAAREKASRDMEMKRLEKKVVCTGAFTTKLEEVLALEEAVLVIASRLHYYELVRLGRTNKRIRELIFPHRDLKMRKAKLQHAVKCSETYSDPATRPRCWNCNIGVCVGHPRCCGITLGYDSEVRGVPKQTCQLDHHLAHCVPHCSMCYYTTIARNLLGAKRAPCRCLSWPTGDLLCQNCVWPKTGMADIRSEAMVGVIRKRTLDASECGGCGKALRQSGSIWWICGKCKKQCDHEVHAADRRNTKHIEADEV